MYLDMAITILKLVDVLGAFLDGDNNLKTSLAIPFIKYFWEFFRSMFFLLLTNLLPPTSPRGESLFFEIGQKICYSKLFSKQACLGNKWTKNGDNNNTI
jgi:hypothetical protein